MLHGEPGRMKSAASGPLVNRDLVSIALLCFGLLAAQNGGRTLDVLPPTATNKLAASLAASTPHTRHVWRDTPPITADGRVAAYVEIPRGDRRKWEFDMRANRRAIDRVMPADLGGYPVNYGFVPQTISYDGDPFDVLVLGPELAGGRLVHGAIVGLMFMEDETGIDSKVVVSPVDPKGRILHPLSIGDQQRIADFFNKYKRHEPGKFSKVPGWGSIEEGRAHVTKAHAFFRNCRQSPGTACRLPH